MRLPSRSNVTFALLIAWSAVASGITGVSAWQRWHATSKSPSAAAIRVQVKRWHEFVPSAMRTTLSAKEPAIVIFADFQCPFCRRFASTIDSLRERQPGLVIAERHFPLAQLHGEAFEASLAAECARASGHYDQMRSVLLPSESRCAAGMVCAWRPRRSR